MTAPIAVMGATGAVGHAVVRELGAAPLRLGGRREDALDAAARDAAGATERVVVDIDDDAALARFCSGCDVVVNCAGPAHRVGDRVARAALAAGAGYVDAAGEELLHALVPRALFPVRDATIPGFPDGVHAHPYLGPEAVRVARSLGLADLDWYSVFDGEHTIGAIGRAGDPAQGADAAVRALIEAAELDTFGRTRYQLLVFRAEQDATTRTLLLRGTDSYALTAAMVARAALAATGDELQPGSYRAGEQLEPDTELAAVARSPAVVALEELEGEPATAAPVEEGVL